jgi:CBS domain-containing protein
MAKIYILTDRPVREIMTTPVVTVGEDDSIEDLVWKFQRYRYAGFPVLNEKGKLIGMVRDSDILKLFVMTRPDSIIAEKAKDIMRVPPHTISPDATAQEAVEKMFDSNVRLLVVADKDKKVLGIVSREDLVAGIFTRRRVEDWPKT